MGEVHKESPKSDAVVDLAAFGETVTGRSAEPQTLPTEDEGEDEFEEDYPDTESDLDGEFFDDEAEVHLSHSPF
jgi:hypothetical protein